MTLRYVLTPLAEADLDRLWDYAVERFGFDLKDQVLDSPGATRPLESVRN